MEPNWKMCLKPWLALLGGAVLVMIYVFLSLVMGVRLMDAAGYGPEVEGPQVPVQNTPPPGRSTGVREVTVVSTASASARNEDRSGTAPAPPNR